MKKFDKMKRSLALLGHSKLKGALRHTLLLIGCVLVSLGAWAQEATNGFYMHKDWEPNLTECPDGSCGQIRLETFVTGSTVITEHHIPTDIVVVVDQSGSMAYNFNGQQSNYNNSRRKALKDALTNFCQTVQTDAATTQCNHKIAVVGFASGYYEEDYWGDITWDWTNTNILSTESVEPYGDEDGNCILDDEDYRNALVEVTSSSIANGGRHYNAINRIQAEGGTYMQYGLEMAYNILDKRTEKTFIDNNGETQNRAQVVVFFTDGYPGGYSINGYFYEGTYNRTYYDQQTVADAVVEQASAIKGLGAKVFSVGIYTGADPNAAFRTTTQTYNNYQYWSTGTAAANGLMHFISSDYDQNTTSWSANTTSSQNTANKFEDSYFMSATNADQLNNVFGKIAEQSSSGATEWGIETIVQDVISADFEFTIPEGADDPEIKAYMPKCTGCNNNNENDLTFDIEREGALSINTDGTVSGNENRLPNDAVRIEGKKLSLQGISFKDLWCGPEKNQQGQTTGWHGRKLVILIPIHISGNTWGDGIVTNDGPMSVVTPNGVISNNIEFNIPTADVAGEVWTEVVTDQPTTFTTKTIDNKTYYELHNPEDLAWFISYVNGRKGYKDNPVETTHPSANAILMADIDMSAHNWVPIGINTIGSESSPSVVVSYTGTFDGNGHVITGLKNNAGKKFMNGEVSWVFPGMFNKVGNGGVVKNVFVLDADFRGQQRTINNKECFVHHGIIADTLLAGGTIYNCEAAGRITCNNKNPETDVNLIFGGLVGLNQGTVHSCMAMAELTAYTMGGMIGENRGSFSNGFTNGVYHYLDEGSTQNKPIGGIAAINPTAANIKNCYVLFTRNKNTNLAKTNKFGRIVGKDDNGSYKFTTTSCYSPITQIKDRVTNNSEDPTSTMIDVTGNVPADGPGILFTSTESPSLMREARSNDNMVTSNSNGEPSWSEVVYKNRDAEGNITSYTHVPLFVGGIPLLEKLNQGVASGQASWKRTTAGGYATSPNGGDINGDYPILKFTDYKCVASADGIRLDYAATLDEMLDRHNNGNMNVGTNMPSDAAWYTDPEHAATYSVSQSPAIYGGAINLYANDNTTRSTSTTAKTMVYIDENVSLLQDNTTSSIDAYTGQTLKSFSTEWPGDGKGERWHNVSSSLTGSKFGWDYHNDCNEFNWEENPCGWFLDLENDDEALFPTDARSYAVADFYCFYEPQYHWINFRRSTASHFHMDGNHPQIVYTNETEFVRGKGYLMALSTEYFEDHYVYAGEKKHEQFLQNRGTLNNGTITIPVTNTPINDQLGYNTGRTGYNLLGNPYQSYLDFEEFATANEAILNSGEFGKTYAVYDPETDTWLQYGEKTSTGSNTASQFINMHQGFFIQTGTAEGTAQFTNDMRTNDPGENHPGFRGEQRPSYPLINFTLTDSEGGKDIAVLEVGRPENDGAKKIFVSSSTGRLYLRHDSEDFAILFRDMTKGSQPLYFDAKENGTFTLSWNTANANFQSLTLVDNIAGVKYDMLTHDSYTFEGNTDNYKSRFKVVIGEFAGIDEEDGPSTGSGTFAFFDGSEWVVNGQGQLDVVDMLGRTMLSERLTSDQSRVSLDGMAQGVYLMRVTNGNETKVQKIVVR